MKKMSLLLFVFLLSYTIFGREVVKRNSIREFTSRMNTSSSGRYKYINGNSDDSVKVLALLVEFRSDSVSNTTGTGLFGYRVDSLSPSFEDAQELKWYKSDTVYPYDALPHNGRYFENHLKYLQNYYHKVSSGKLKVGFEIFPKQKQIDGNYPDAYQVRLDMARYSPGLQGKDETDLDFAIRRTTSLLRFVKDAIVTADTSGTNPEESPFYNLHMDENGTLWEIDNSGDSTKVFVLIFHAGSNYLTDGGGNSAAANSPSDMSDLFINQDYFDDYYDIENDTIFKGFAKELNGIIGIKVQEDSTNLLVSEVMLCAETSNQDSLNFGINGLLVNLLARQMGVPTLHNKSGFSATGKFGIMDYSGYSAGRGFIPPYPSAFVRAFMGWSKPAFLSEGTTSLTAVGFTGEVNDSENDILLVPINDDEYWLIENRQRNLSGIDPFIYDTTSDTILHISSSGFDFSLKNLKLEIASSNVITNVDHFDIGIGGSGCLVWHIDEKIIDARQELDILNSDSTYRAVALEEADGINDIGIYFVNALQQRLDDYGGSEDIFPHLASFNGSTLKTTMNSKSSPSTQSNDGGNSFLSIAIHPTNMTRTEKYLYQRTTDTKFEKYFVLNYSNRNMTVTVSKDSEETNISRETPLQLTDGSFSDLFFFNSIGATDSPKELILLDSSGNLFMITPENEIISDSTQFTIVDPFYKADGTVTDTLYVTTKINAPASMPTSLTSSYLIPHKNGSITVWQTGTTPTKEIQSSNYFTTPIVANGDNWAVGTSTGSILLGSAADTLGTLSVSTSDAVTSLAVYNSSLGIYAATTMKGLVVLFNNQGVLSSAQLPTIKDKISGPFSMVTGNLDSKDNIEIVLTDKTQNLWILQADSAGTQFSTTIENSTFPGYFTDTHAGYKIPENNGTPSLADIDGDKKLDILVPGTNGVYAFNHLGVLLDDWPAILDQGEWYLRKSIVTSPLTFSKAGETMTLFSTLTGDNGTFYISKIDSAKDDPISPGKKIVYFKNEFHEPDSSLNLSAGLVDTLLTLNDSVVIPSNAPGGLIDVRGNDGKRPSSTITPPLSESKRYSLWPLTLGAPGAITPILCDLNSSDTLLTIAAINENGTLYQWKVSKNQCSLTDSLGAQHWYTVGGNLSRSFSKSATTTTSDTEESVTKFYSYPNPAKIYEDRGGNVRFRYTLGADATEVTLSIYTVSGIKVFESSSLKTNAGTNEFILPDIDSFGSALYRCKLNVSFSSGDVHKFWKMAILRGTL